MAGQYFVASISFPCSFTNPVQYFIDFLKLFISEISHPAVKGSLGISFFSNVANHTLLSEDFASVWLTTIGASDFFFLPARNFMFAVFQSCTVFSRSSSCFSASASALLASSLALTASGWLESLLLFIMKPVIVLI